jgi:hypothetical protein
LWWLLSGFCCWSSLLDTVSLCWDSILMLCVSCGPSDVCFWGGPLLILAQWSESSKSLSECWCLSGATRLRRLMSWCCWALWVFINPFNIAYR